MGDISGSSQYKRILIKLSGEALAGDIKTGIDPVIIRRIADEIKEVHSLGIEIALVIGAGNFFRGSLGTRLGLDRLTGDNMGMLATVMNALAFHDLLKKINVPARIMTSFKVNEIAEHYIIPKASSHLKKGRVVIIAGGTGHPYFTTDTAAGLRAVELEADLLLKATRVDGVYTSDPEKDKNAKKIDSISFIDTIKGKLRVMDLTAVSLCMDNNMKIIIFNLFNRGSLKKVILGEEIGTKIS